MFFSISMTKNDAIKVGINEFDTAKKMEREFPLKLSISPSS